MRDIAELAVAHRVAEQARQSRRARRAGVARRGVPGGTDAWSSSPASAAASASETPAGVVVPEGFDRTVASARLGGDDDVSSSSTCGSPTTPASGPGLPPSPTSPGPTGCCSRSMRRRAPVLHVADADAPRHLLLRRRRQFVGSRRWSRAWSRRQPHAIATRPACRSSWPSRCRPASWTIRHRRVVVALVRRPPGRVASAMSARRSMNSGGWRIPPGAPRAPPPPQQHSDLGQPSAGSWRLATTGEEHGTADEDQRAADHHRERGIATRGWERPRVRGSRAAVATDDSGRRCDRRARRRSCPSGRSWSVPPSSSGVRRRRGLRRGRAVRRRRRPRSSWAPRSWSGPRSSVGAVVGALGAVPRHRSTCSSQPSVHVPITVSEVPEKPTVVEPPAGIEPE